MGFCFDSGHCNLESPPTFHLLERYADRLCVTHLHDNYGKADDHRLPFDGAIPWAQLAQTLSRIGYTKPLNIEVGMHTYTAGTYSAAEKAISPEALIREGCRRLRAVAACQSGHGASRLGAPRSLVPRVRASAAGVDGGPVVQIKTTGATKPVALSHARRATFCRRPEG